MTFLGGQKKKKKRVIENSSTAKWCHNISGLEVKGQPEDRWPANHV